MAEHKYELHSRHGVCRTCRKPKEDCEGTK